MKKQSLRDIICLLRIIPSSLVLWDILTFIMNMLGDKSSPTSLLYKKYVPFFPSELLKGPKIKKKRERIPVNTTCEYFDSKNTPVKDTSLTQLPSNEGKKVTTKNLEQSDASPQKQPFQASPLHTALQAIRNIVEPERERKRVKIQDENHVTFASNSRGGNNSLAPAVPRSVSASVSAQGTQHRPASLFFRCMNCALHFFIYFLSVACSVLPQLQLPTLNLSLKLPFRRTKTLTNRKDSWNSLWNNFPVAWRHSRCAGSMTAHLVCSSIKNCVFGPLKLPHSCGTAQGNKGNWDHAPVSYLISAPSNFQI